MNRILFFVIVICFANQLNCQILIDSLKIVDYHVHVFSEALVENLEEQGHSFEKSGFEIFNQNKSDYRNIEKIIKDNSNAKMLLISAGYAYKDVKNQSAEVEEKALQKENNLLRELVKKYPDKLIGFYGVNPLKKFTIREIKRCHEELGLHGIKLHFQGNNINLSDYAHLKKVKEIFEFASKENIPILIHNNAWNLDAGIEYARIFIDSLLKKETESLTIIFAHTGGGGGYYNYTHDLLHVFKDYLQNSEDSKRHKIYFELSGTISIKEYRGERPMGELKTLIEKIGEERFLFGSDYPFLNCEKYIKIILSELKLDETVLKRIIERDIFRLHRIPTETR